MRKARMTDDLLIDTFNSTGHTEWMVEWLWMVDLEVILEYFKYLLEWIEKTMKPSVRIASLLAKNWIQDFTNINEPYPQHHDD
jgi:hypothetical protein